MRGFTLLELLVVVAIIAIASSLLAINAWPSEAAAAEREARRLGALLESAMSEARASGRAMAWSPEGNGYAFFRRDSAGSWTRFPQDSVYRARQLAPGTALLGERALLVPYGVPGSLEASISGGNTTIVIRSAALGRVSLERIHAD